MNVNVLEDASAVDDEAFVFGSFRLIPAQRMLLDHGKPLRLGSRALEILVSLVGRAGETIRKDQLIARTWPDTVVEENALRVHVAALRKALGDGRAGNRYIANVAGRGYAFVAPVAREPEQQRSAPTPANGAPVGSNLPTRLTRVIGRDRIIAEVGKQFARRRFLTIVGPGGIGKTTVAVAIAESVSGSYPDGVWFVGLAPLPDPDLVVGALGTVLGISSSGVDPLAGLAAWLRDKQALIVLDSCEHVIGAAATIAEAVLKAAPRVCILATSREALRAEGEWLHRLPSLELPPNPANLTTSEALQYSAVQLFVERARASADAFQFADTDVPAVLEICRRLDGVPLALELAAARVEAFGIEGLATRLDDRFALLTKGRRTALPRHQTLRAMMDWSYDLLPDTEKVILRRLAVFHGDFTMEAADAVAADQEIPTAEVSDRVANLAAKSLIVTDTSGDGTYHRLLDITRAYASEKLTNSGDIERTSRLLAEYYRDFFAPAEAESESLSQSEWLAIYGRHIDNVRASLDWAFFPDGDIEIGVALTIVVVPLWVQLSLFGECRERVERALASLDGAAAVTARSRMQLSAALAWSLMYGVGRTREAGPAWATALELAERLDDRGYRLRTLWGLCIDQFNNGEFRAALEFARRYAALATSSTDSVDLMMADRILATALHYLGDQKSARHHIERALAYQAALAQQRQIVRLRFDMLVSTHYFSGSHPVAAGICRSGDARGRA
jgi:predicted ATPase/DNA-binding winged helix-turn-helix (wHTH) protein